MSGDRTPALVAAYAFCREVARREAKNFYWAFRALPRHKSDAMCAVYAFMRKADDLADDESLSLEARRVAMAEWTAAWRQSRGAATAEPLFVALNDTQQRFGISDELLEQLVAGTTMDLQPNLPGTVFVTESTIARDGTSVEREYMSYDTFEHLYRYCYLVASVVGLVTIRIFGYREGAGAEDLAERTGVAFPLTPILRDVGEDAQRGRLYLPQGDLHSCHASMQEVIRAAGGDTVSSATQAVLRREIERAQDYYRSGFELIPLIDKDAQPAMRGLVTIYHRLLERIARDPSAVFRERVSVPTVEKLGILGRGLAGSVLARLR